MSSPLLRRHTEVPGVLGLVRFSGVESKDVESVCMLDMDVDR